MTRDCGPCGGTGEIWLVLTNQVGVCPHCKGTCEVDDGSGPSERQIEWMMDQPSLAERMAPPITMQDHL